MSCPRRAIPREAAERLVRMANQAGGNDNATVVVLDVMVGEPLRPPRRQDPWCRVAAGAASLATGAAAAPEVPVPGDTMVAMTPQSPVLPERGPMPPVR